MLNAGDMRSNLQDTDGNYDASQGPQNLTGRTPTNMLNSTLTEKVAGGTSMGQQTKNVQFTVKEGDAEYTSAMGAGQSSDVREKTDAVQSPI